MCLIDKIDTSVINSVELPGAGLGRMLTVNSVAATEAGRASVKMWENMTYTPQILALPLLLPLPDFWLARYKSPPRFSDLSASLYLINIKDNIIDFCCQGQVTFVIEKNKICKTDMKITWSINHHIFLSSRSGKPLFEKTWFAKQIWKWFQTDDLHKFIH